MNGPSWLTDDLVRYIIDQVVKAGPWATAAILVGIMAWRDSWPWKRRK